MTSARGAPLLVLLALLACGAEEGTGEDWALSAGPPPPGLATELVTAHDAARAGAVPAPTPPLRPLLWSAGVAATAQAWADGCTYAHNPRLGALALGENLAATAPPGSRTPAEVVGLWSSEARFYDLATNACDAEHPENEAGTCGHYTQLVWRSTSLVGCAKRTCATGSPFGPALPEWDYWVCDYAPPGNVVGLRPY